LHERRIHAIEKILQPIMSCPSPFPSPQQIHQQLFPLGTVQPAVLPSVWNVQALLTPFGGQIPHVLQPSDQLVIANVTYEQARPIAASCVSAYTCTKACFITTSSLKQPAGKRGGGGGFPIRAIRTPCRPRPSARSPPRWRSRRSTFFRGMR
jgi:hypothetical protein